MTAPGFRIAGAARVGEALLFQSLSLDCPAGQWTCLLGASGVGKSTLLRQAAGLDTGIAFEGSVTTEDGAGLQGRVAYMAQADLLLPWRDVLGNVVIGGDLRGEPAARDRAMALIEQVGLGAHARKRPGQLSGGMRQRAALARTLMEDRPVALLDEPFSALDARTRAEMQELAAVLLRGRTVLLVTHEPGEAARLGHRIYVMTPEGLTSMDVPGGEPVRPYDDPQVFACQARLMNHIREAA